MRSFKKVVKEKCMIYMEAISELVSELSSGDDERAEAAAQRMAALPVEESSAALEALDRLLETGDEDERWWALRALATLPGAEVGKRLVAALGDRATSVQQCAALGLRLRPEPAAIPSLISALGGVDSLMASLAADALIAIGEPAVPALLQVMREGNQGSRLEAARALATIGDERAIPLLLESLEEDSAMMEYWASEGLERMGVGMTFFLP